MPLSELDYKAKKYDASDYEYYYVEQRIWDNRSQWPGLFPSRDDLDAWLIKQLDPDQGGARYSINEIVDKINYQYQNTVLDKAIDLLNQKAAPTPAQVTGITTVTPDILQTVPVSQTVQNSNNTGSGTDAMARGYNILGFFIVGGILAVGTGVGYYINKKSNKKKK